LCCEVCEVGACRDIVVFLAAGKLFGIPLLEGIVILEGSTSLTDWCKCFQCVQYSGYSGLESWTWIGMCSGVNPVPVWVHLAGLVLYILVLMSATFIVRNTSMIVVLA
jgi:hypothetical protein